MQTFKPFFPKINKHFPTPRFLSFNPVSIDISPRHIRVMQLEEAKVGLVPKLYKDVTLKDSFDVTKTNEQGEFDIEGANEMISILKSLKKEFKLNYVVCSLPELKTYIFRTQLPVEASSNVASAVRFGLEENVPLKVDTVNFDYFVVEPDEGRKADSPLDVVVNVFPKDVISSYTKLLKMAGLFPLSFQAESTALARSLVSIGDRNAYLIIRLLEDRVGVAIVEDEVVQYASSINISAKDISEDYNSEAALELKEELSKVLIFWVSNKRNAIKHDNIKTALITGEYALAKGMEEFLEKHLKIDVEVGNVWSNCFSTNDFIPKIQKEDALNFSAAIGLGIKGIKHY